MVKLKHIKRGLFFSFLFFYSDLFGQNLTNLKDHINLINKSFMSIHGFDINKLMSFDIGVDKFWYLSESNDTLYVHDIESNKTSSIALDGQEWTYIKVNGSICSVIEQLRIAKYRVTNYIYDDKEIQAVDSEYYKELDQYYYNNGNKVAIGFFNTDKSLNQGIIEVNAKELKVEVFSTLTSFISPTQYIDFNLNFNLVTDPCTYEIKLFDNNMELVTTSKPVSNEISWSNKYIKLIEKQYKPNSKKEFQNKVQNIPLKDDVIWSSSFLDENKIAVYRSYPTKESFQFALDFWEINNKKINLISSNLITPRWTNNDHVIGIDCLPFFLGGIGTKLIFDNGFLYAIVLDVVDDINGKTLGEYKILRSNYFKTKEPIIKIYKYEISS